MKVSIIDNIPAFRIDIYVYGDAVTTIGQFQVFDSGSARLEWLPYEQGTLPERPTISFDKYVWEAILSEAIGNHPSNEVVADAKKVRDRLLAMIESEWQSRQLEKH